MTPMRYRLGRVGDLSIEFFRKLQWRFAQLWQVKPLGLDQLDPPGTALIYGAIPC